jgi:hypothetical protein
MVVRVNITVNESERSLPLGPPYPPMALPDGFLTPRGLFALAAVVPIVVLYLIRPDPERRELPTLRFLAEERKQGATTPILRRLRRTLLLVLQVLAVAVLAASLASPYVLVSESETVEETVIVLDTSASMATTADGRTRLSRAVSAAREAATGTTSVVTTDGSGRVTLRRGGTREAVQTLDEIGVVDAASDLGAAVSAATAIAGENARIVVFSDFADDADWGQAVQTARARGIQVELRQFAGGGGDNVGVVGLSFSGGEVTASVKNFGDDTATRRLALEGRSTRVTLQPGDVASLTLPVPPGGGELRLSPGDSFPTDDAAYVAAPEDASVDVLLLTNDRNRYLTTALSLVEQVSLTVDSPPTAIEGDYDVVIYGNVAGDRLLQGNVEAGRQTVADGGGVAVVAQEDLPRKYGDLLLVDPEGVGTNPTVGTAADHRLTADVDFPPPERYVRGSLRSGRPLVSTTDGAPLLAVEDRGAGRVLYYGYLEEASSFKFNYQYPVFWKRAAFYLAGRDPLPELNRQTGDRLAVGNETRVRTPSGVVTGSTIALDEVGFYAVGDRRYGASLLSESESNVRAPDLNASRSSGDVPARQEERYVPRTRTEWTALTAVVVALGELAYLRRRGDL